ncbi:MAG: polysaccharide biosynthesis protein [Gammaproteobacteria bacterium]|nr:NAD-dependent epimerase/dehydratase family protein [Rhodocyclaceae bacterium]MBU3910517.1 polysaccharide biosynthesis protein [Gammaproteobacteria bacterium]MBU3989581.1 polysaccharide biosynthesis protein [Gammaproteobacteria bacterium]MBU4004998.1 polysaccharide biosynthesis protein [Gammaproteobacteria bacterium]MBU4020591.1 polysaccharide biosynthesis protein [Gammaproteobacteria bacterium]
MTDHNPFANSTVLITGGTGSFGHEFLDYLKSRDCREVRIFSRDELKQELMRVALADPKIKFYIGDVRDRDSVDNAMRSVDYVFHAAALKQVPSCEFFPMQAVLTNVTGSHNVIESAMAHGVQRLVCLSTDKAVYPVNAMGMTKALMEKVTQAAARARLKGGTLLSSVRYGNVMASRGSVIPLFVKQMREGKPLTVTVPVMTRFLLPLPLAIELVAFAFNHGQQGDLFVRKAPACTVADLAQALKNLFHSDVPIQVIGMRHGEKIYETLATREELAKAEDMGDYYRVPMDDRDLNYSKYFTEGDTNESSLEDYTSHNTEQLDVAAVETLMLTLPEVREALQAAGYA